MKGFISKVKDKAAIAAVAAEAAILGLPVYAVGDFFKPVSVQSSAISGQSALNGIVGAIVGIFRIVGIIMVIAGIAAYIMAYRREDSDNQHKAALSAIAGVGLILLQPILSGIGFIAG